MNDTRPPKLKRRWYQFSIRTLLVVVVVICLGLGIRVQRARTNRARLAAVGEAVAWIKELGGGCERHHNQLRPPTWLEELLDDPGSPDDPVKVVVVRAVQLENTHITDAKLEQLKGLKNLTWIALNHTQITDAGLEHLNGFNFQRRCLPCRSVWCHWWWIVHQPLRAFAQWLEVFN